MSQLLERQFLSLLAERAGSGRGAPEYPLHAVVVNSAATGLHLALEALGVGPGDEVITSPYNAATTAVVIRHLGASPVFVDIDPASLNIDPARIERSITPRTKVILPVHVAGLASEMGPILRIARQRGLKVIEDATCALPASYEGRLVGTLGSDAAIFSLNTAGKESAAGLGLLVTPDAEIASRCRILRLHGVNQLSRNSYDTGSLSRNPGGRKPSGPLEFRNDQTDLTAAVGVELVRRTWQCQERRAAIAARYNEELRDLPTILPTPAGEGDLHAWQLYIIRLDHTIRITRDEFIARMGHLGIECGVHFVPLHLHPYWREVYQLQPHHFPSAWQAYERVVSLPVYARLTEDDQSRIIDAVRSIVKLAVARPRHSLIFSTAAAG